MYDALTAAGFGMEVDNAELSANMVFHTSCRWASTSSGSKHVIKRVSWLIYHGEL